MAFDYREEYHRYKQYYLKNLRIFYFQPLTQTSLSLILSLLTVIFFGFFALKPTLTTIVDLWKEIGLKKEVDQKLDKKIQNLNSMQAVFAESGQYIPLVNNTLPDEPDFSRMEREIEFLAYQNNLVISHASFNKFVLFGNIPIEDSEENKKELEKPVEFDLVSGGSYFDLKNFLSKLEKLDRLIVINSITFGTESEIEGAELQLDIKGRAYYYPRN